jgi:putative iron-dependent peroxidase
MFIGKPEGNYDRILDYSRAATGALFFVPSTDFLDDPPGPGATTAEGVAAPPSASEPGESEEAPVAAIEGSLGIGSLREVKP